MGHNGKLWGKLTGEGDRGKQRESWKPKILKNLKGKNRSWKSGRKVLVGKSIRKKYGVHDDRRRKHLGRKMLR